MTSPSFRVRKFSTDTNAVAATEFALVVPFMLTLLVGGVELSNGMALNVKVSATAHAVADMVTQNTSVSTASLNNILTGASVIMAPYSINSGSLSLMTIQVSEISSDTNGNLTLRWSRSYDGINFGSGRSDLSGLIIPPSVNGTVGNANNPNNQNDQVSFIVSEASYNYTPNLGYVISGTVVLKDVAWLFPRCSTDSPANSSGPAYYDVQYTGSSSQCSCLQHLQYKTC